MYLAPEVVNESSGKKKSYKRKETQYYKESVQNDTSKVKKTKFEKHNTENYFG